MSVHRIYTTLLLLLSVMAMYAQSRVAHQRYHLLLRHYEQKLQNFHDSLYADSVTVAPTLTEEDMAPLFMPMTFYKTVTHNAFTLDKQLSPLEEHLLNVYLDRPDRVERTETQLEKVGPVIAPKTVTQTPNSVVEQIKPDEPDVAPIDMVVLKPNFWTYGGDFSLKFDQYYVSQNWYQGGEGNYSMRGGLTLQANYNNKQKVKWDNKLEVKLGLQTTKSDTLHKLKTSEDLLRYTGRLGLQATKKWYYTLQVEAYTQMMRAYDKNQPSAKSDFMSPFNLNVSLGMDYNVNWLKNHLTGSVHLGLLSYNLKYVDRLSLATRNGIDEGHHAKHDFGSKLTADLNWKFTNNISWKTRLSAYTSYERTEVEWENTFSFKFNQFISATLFLYPRFDDNVARDEHHGYFQYKEYTSLGFAYSF